MSTRVRPLVPSFCGGLYLPSGKVLEIVSDRNTLRLRSSQEILHHWVRVIAKGDFDGAIKSMEFRIIASPLIGLVLSHQRQQFLCGPTFGLEVVVIRGRGAGVHLQTFSTILHSCMGFGIYHEVDGASSTKDMCTGNNCTTAIQVWRCVRVIEGGRLRIQFHVPRIDSRTVHPMSKVTNVARISSGLEVNRLTMDY